MSPSDPICVRPHLPSAELSRVGPFSGKKKAHKHKLFGPVAPGTTTGLSQGQTQFVPGTNLGCPWDKPVVFSLFYTVEAQFVPGTNPACPWDKPVTKGNRKSLCIKCLCAFFARYFCQGKTKGQQLKGKIVS